MQIQDVFRFFQAELQCAEQFMEKEMRSEVLMIPEVIRHLIGSGGKRFRPLLLLASAELCGYRGDLRDTMSAVIEFIHTATLLHDDVIDEARTRRGKTSANQLWGNAASVLVGDFLYSKSFRLMTATGNFRILELLSATTNVMSEGEVFQLMKCGDVHITEADYLKIVEKKTAVLISAACAVGPILGNLSEGAIESLSRYGMCVGMAFQITDDTLDYMAEEGEFGKVIGKDLSEGKITLPLIHTLSHCSEGERAAIAACIEKRELTGEATTRIRAAVEDHGGVAYALAKAKGLVEEGKGCLSLFSPSEAREALEAIADFVLERRA